MRITKDIGPGLLAGLTNDNKLVIMVETDEGEFLAEVKDIDYLTATLRHLELVQMENRGESSRSPLTTAEADLNRRQASPCQYTQSHTRDWCGNPNCREG